MKHTAWGSAQYALIVFSFVSDASFLDLFSFLVFTLLAERYGLYRSELCVNTRHTRTWKKKIVRKKFWLRKVSKLLAFSSIWEKKIYETCEHFCGFKKKYPRKITKIGEKNWPRKNHKFLFVFFFYLR